MKTRTALALAGAAMIAGLTIGSVGLAVGATSDAGVPAPEAAPGYGMAHRGDGERLVDMVAELTGIDLDEILDRRANGESLADIARSAGTDVDAILDAALSERAEFLDERVAAGQLTEEQRSEILQRMAEELARRLESDEWPPPARGPRHGVRIVEVISELTDLEAAEIHERRADGESFAQIAESEGVDEDALTQAILDAAQSELEERLPQILNSTDAPGTGGPGRGRGFGHGPIGVPPAGVE